MERRAAGQMGHGHRRPHRLGEDVETALQREVLEELNIRLEAYTFIGRYVYESDIEKELIHVHKTIFEGEIRPNMKELDEGKFWSEEKIKCNIGKGIFTPNFEFEFKKFFIR